jgi:hypothetical protein
MRLALCIYHGVIKKRWTYSFKTGKLVASLQIDNQGILAHAAQQDAATGIERRAAAGVDGAERAGRLKSGFDDSFRHDSIISQREKVKFSTPLPSRRAVETASQKNGSLSGQLFLMFALFVF